MATEQRIGLDVSVVESEDGSWTCVPMKTALSKNCRIVASMKQGTIIEPVREDEHAVYVSEPKVIKIYKHMLVEQ